MAFYDNNEYYQLGEQVKMAITQTRPDMKLQITSIICQMLDSQELDDKMRKAVDEMAKYCQKYLQNPAFRKAVHKRHALMQKEPIIYFGDDPKGDYYDFDEGLEKELTAIEFKITTFLGNVMAWIQEQESI